MDRTVDPTRVRLKHYPCVDADGGLYSCNGETFEKMYQPVDWSDM